MGNESGSSANTHANTCEKHRAWPQTKERTRPSFEIGKGLKFECNKKTGNVNVGKFQGMCGNTGKFNLKPSLA